MKAKLTFDLPFDDYAYRRATQSWSMAMALYEINDYLRDVYKYQDPPDDIEKIREKFYEILLENNISIDDLLE